MEQSSGKESKYRLPSTGGSRTHACAEGPGPYGVAAHARRDYLPVKSLVTVFLFFVFPFQREEDGRDQLLVCPQKAAFQESGSSPDP